MTAGLPDRAEPGRPRRAWVVGAAVLAAVGGWIGYQMVTWPNVAALAQHNPETTAFIERYRQTQRAQGRPDAVRWEWAPYDRISPNLKRAVVSAEDMEFYFHHGFSSAEMKDALSRALRRFEAPRGASTITQQLAKNLWLSPSRDPLRKAKEALLTWQLERHLTKRRILELYLNVVELGPGIYGAEAAAEYYFGKPAADLTEHEAAELAAGLPRPSAWHPGRDSGPYQAYVAEVERRMGVATFLWRAVGAQPPAAMPEVALNPDSLLRLLGDTTEQPVVDSLAAAADSDTATALPLDQDSVQAVGAARDALLRANPGAPAVGLVVAAFTRDTAGFLVDLVPASGGDTAVVRGGVVRVGKDGAAVIVKLHQ
jgi:monofunctional biosynthetic peptidoglycan transglycosylase